MDVRLEACESWQETPPPPPVDLELWSKFSAPVEDEGLGNMSNEESELFETELCISNKVKWLMTAVGYSLQGGEYRF